MSALVALAPGTIFAKDFRVVRRLASGGMGAVYVVEQLSTGRARALKLMHSGLVENPALRQKFEQEARIGARVASEHVVEVVGAGVDEATGAPWLAMELLEGEDLASAVRRRGPLEPGEVMAILEQLCHALGAAHDAGIVHRDLKPENVFLAASRRAGAAATVKVLDFGIARVAVEALSASTGAMGSPYWMAPEQTERASGIGPQADVWALGLVVFHLLVGKSFWKTAQTENASVAQFIRELVIEPIPPGSERAKELGVEIPVALDPWFARCLDRDPKKRFPDARAAYEAIAQLLGAPMSFGAVSASPKGPSSASGPVQITPAQHGSMGLAHARTVSLTEEEIEEKLPIAQSGNGALVAISAALALVLVLGGGVVLYAARANDPPSPAPSAPTARAALPPSCTSGMIAVPPGTPTIGSSDGDESERPAHQLTLNGFCVDEVEVTVAAYDECAKAGACAPLATKAAWADIKDDERAFWDAFCNEGRPDRQNHPANCVTFDQASAFCAWVHKRLPTEEEWEYAARGEEARIYPWGEGAPTALRANVCASECAVRSGVLGHPLQAMHPGNDNWEGTAPVRSFTAGASPFGAFDMAGNVAEWTSSRHCPYPGNNCSSDNRTTRGGSFAEEEEKAIRASHRHKDAPGARSPMIGFRCAK